jgi:hypothetical protein
MSAVVDWNIFFINILGSAALYVIGREALVFGTKAAREDVRCSPTS